MCVVKSLNYDVLHFHFACNNQSGAWPGQDYLQQACVVEGEGQTRKERLNKQEKVKPTCWEMPQTVSLMKSAGVRRRRMLTSFHIKYSHCV